MRDTVTTTTPLFAELIKPLNPNIYVLENSINLKENQWINKKVPSEKIRFIWGGGISHIVDLRLLKDEFKKFDKDFLSKSQMYLCGYDLRVRMPDGSLTNDSPRTSQWGFFEGIFNNNGKYIKNAKYNIFLNDFKENDTTNYGWSSDFKDEFYQRRFTKAILHYGGMYNEADVALAPLKNNHMFNYSKSELKLIEAGAHTLPLIASNFGSYTLNDIEGKKDGLQKGFLIDENKHNWYEKMKWYVNNPNAVKEHGANNRKYCEEHFSTEVVNKKRIQLYKDVLAGRKSDI